MNASSDWLARLRRIHNQSFDFDWQAHLEQLNAQFGLTEANELKTSLPSTPPIWFNGDVEGIQSYRWALVISLNHQLGKYAKATPDSLWHLSRTHNAENYYPHFSDPLALVGRTALDDDTRDLKQFAAERMVFIETFPYASQKFALSWDTQLQLAASDPGYATAREVEQLLLEEAQPGLVLVNGNNAMWMFEAANKDRLVHWKECRYPSASRPSRTLHHWEGWLKTTDRPTPVLAFPFLRAISSHNSTEEIAQLAGFARELVLRTPNAKTPAT